MMLKRKILLSIIATFPFLIGCGRKSDETHHTVTLSAENGYFLDKTHQTMSLSIKDGITFYSVLSGVPNPTSLEDYHIFNHWEIDNVPVVNDFAIETDIIAKATYSYVEPIKITYDLNGGTYDESSAPIEITNNRDVKWADAIRPDSNIIVAENPLEEFDCWSFDSEERRSISEIYSFSENTTIYALYRPKYLKFTALEDNSAISYIADGSIDVSGLMYSKTGNSNDWHSWINTNQISLNNKGDSVYVKNTLDCLSLSSQEYFSFILTGSIAASGNVNSMINFADITRACFCSMFRNCTNLYSAPSLPALVLQSRCYQDMFRGCTNLIVAPDLPATILDKHCYHSMFYNCKKLSIPPIDLPAKNVESHCYYCMFYLCSSLEKTPNILSKNETTNSYVGMFAKCQSLSSIYLAYAGEFTSAFSSWVSEINQTGDMYYLGYDMTRGENAIPKSWHLTPKNKLILNLINCSVDSSDISFHYGETVVIVVSPDEGYKLPDSILCSVVEYDYKKDTGVITLTAPASDAYITISAIKQNT